MEKLEMASWAERMKGRGQIKKGTAKCKGFFTTFRTYYLCISQLLVMEVETTISR